MVHYKTKPCKLIIRGRKAQFYIFTSIILCAIAFTLLHKTSVTYNANKDFKELCNNYVSESSRVINYALNEQTDMEAQFQTYTNSYISYSKTKNPSFGVIYLLKSDTNITIENKASEPMKLTNPTSITLNPGETTTITTTNSVTYSLLNTSKTMQFSENSHEIKSICLSRTPLITNIQVHNA